MRAAALDLSSKTGWAVWNGSSGRPELGTKQLVGFQYDNGTMLELFRKWLGPWLRMHEPEIIFIERWLIAGHMDGTTIGKQIMLAGFTEWACKAAGIKTVLVTSAQWRKFCYGKASLAPGEDWKTKATGRCRHLGWEFPDHNAAEAGLILDWGLCTVGKVNPPWRDDLLLPRIAA